MPFLSIVDTSCDEAAARAKPGAAIGIIGTEATLRSRLFDSEFARRGFVPLLPKEGELRKSILPAIEQVKASHAAAGGQQVGRAVQALLDRGAEVVVLACTETPLALDAIASPLRQRCVDTNTALARACVAWRGVVGWAGVRVRVEVPACSRYKFSICLPKYSLGCRLFPCNICREAASL